MAAYMELSLLLFYYSYMLFQSVRSNIIIYRTCYVTLGYNRSECALLGTEHQDNTSASLESLVQPTASVVIMMLSLAEALTGAIACIFVAPWSDRYGRRVPLVAALAGATLTYIFTTIFGSSESLSPWILFICFLPIYCTGGIIVFTSVMMCYVNDVTSVNNRGVKIARFEGCLFLGAFLGAISGSYLLEHTNYATTYAFATICSLISLGITLLRLPESVENPEIEGRVRALFQCKHFVNMVKVTFKKRENYDRCILLYCIMMYTIIIIATRGDSAVKSLFLRAKFHWSLQEYTVYGAVESLLKVLGAVLGVFLLHRVWKLPEEKVVPMGLTSQFLGFTMTGLAPNTGTIYLAPFLFALGGAVNPMLQSMMFRIIPSEESGKIYAFIGSLDSVLASASASFLYTALYNATIDINPAFYNFLSAAVIGAGLLASLVMLIVRGNPDFVARMCLCCRPRLYRDI